MSEESVCAQMERGEFKEEAGRNRSLNKTLRSDGQESDGVLDGFWQDGIGAGIGLAMFAGSVGYGLGIVNVVEETPVAWGDIVAAGQSLGIFGVILFGIVGAVLLGFGMGYHQRQNEEADDE